MNGPQRADSLFCKVNAYLFPFEQHTFSIVLLPENVGQDTDGWTKKTRTD